MIQPRTIKVDPNAERERIAELKRRIKTLGEQIAEAAPQIARLRAVNSPMLGMILAKSDEIRQELTEARALLSRLTS